MRNQDFPDIQASVLPYEHFETKVTMVRIQEQ